MFTRMKKRVFCIAIMLVLTAFVGMAVNVSADDLPPVADADGPYVADECAIITFDASGSSDPDGDSLQYRWMFEEGMWTDWSSNPTATYQWMDDYIGSVTVEVSDGNLIDSDITTVTVINNPPFIEEVIQNPLDVYVDEEVSLDVTFFDGYGRIASGDTYNAIIDWADGSASQCVLGIYEFNFMEAHVYTEAGVYSVIITITDDNGGQVSEIWEIVINEKLVEAGPDGTIDEGSPFISAGFLADDSGTYTAQVDYGDGIGIQELLLNPGNTFDLLHIYCDNGVYTILVTVFNEGVVWGSDSVIVIVNNVAPTIESMSGLPADPLQLGLPMELNGEFSDPGCLDTHVATIDWGDGETTSIDVPFATYSVVGDHLYAVPGTYLITLTVTDDDGGSDIKVLEYSVVDVESVDAGPDGFINEGDMFTSAGFFTSSGMGLYTATVDYGDGAGSQPLSLSSEYLFDLNHQYLEDGIYTVIVNIFKDGSAFISDNALVTVYNVAPIITSLSKSPTNPVHLGVKINLVGEFTDPGVLDSHIAVIQWGDGKTTTMNLLAGVYQISGNHTYASAGGYTINLTVTDDDGGSDSESISVVIYKSCCGFHPGCGWLKFEFGSKCKRGHNSYCDNIEFQFHLVHLNVHSQIYKWLSGIGTKVTCKGVGH